MTMEFTKQSLSAIVLAGGQSRRMGRDKALIEIEGKPLIQRTCEVALQCAAPVWVVTPRVEAYRVIVPSDCRFIQETPLPGETELAGPLVGFAQGLVEVRSAWVLLLACDLPFLNPAILHQWAAQLADVTHEIALLASRENRWEPLCGFYRTEILPDLQTAIAQGERSFQRWLAHHPVRAIVPTDAATEAVWHRMLFNCNTPADLENLDRVM